MKTKISPCITVSLILPSDQCFPQHSLKQTSFTCFQKDRLNRLSVPKQELFPLLEVGKGLTSTPLFAQLQPLKESHMATCVSTQGSPALVTLAMKP